MWITCLQKQGECGQGGVAGIVYFRSSSFHNKQGYPSGSLSFVGEQNLMMSQMVETI